MVKKITVILIVLLVAAGAVAIYVIGPRNIVGRLWYDQRREGHLKVGDRAPTIDLTTLDGNGRVSLQNYIGGKPLVLIFGSYT